MPAWLTVALALGVGYLLGGIPWALVIGTRFFGVDPREHGSGNLGATNVLRVLGARAAIATLLLDALKGSAAVLFAFAIVPDSAGQSLQEWTAVAAMGSAVAGHAYSPYIRFRGGKGVATSAGGLFVLTPIAAAIELALFIALVASTRIVSVASILIALAYPPLVLWLYWGHPAYVTTSFLLAGFVIWLHRSNIVRIARGEERKISLSRRGEAARTDSERKG